MLKHAHRQRCSGLIAVGLAAAVLVSCKPTLAPPEGRELIVERGRGVVPTSYIGLHIQHAADGKVWPSAPFAGWRLWDRPGEPTALAGRDPKGPQRDVLPVHASAPTIDIGPAPQLLEAAE